MGRSAAYHCPICGQYMDFCAVMFRNHPFIDGSTYRRMCFCCAHVPQDIIQICDKDGNVVEEQGPFFDHKHLREPVELVFIGAANSPLEAQRSVQAVKRRIRDVGVRELNKLKLRRPSPEFEENPEWEEEQRQIWGRREKTELKKKRRSAKKDEAA